MRATLPGLTLLVGLVWWGFLAYPLAILLGLVVVGGAVWAGSRAPIILPPATEKVDTLVAGAVLDVLRDAIVLLDGKGNVLAAHRAAYSVLGDALKDKPLMLTLRQPDAVEAVRRVLDGKAPTAEAEIEFSGSVRRTYSLEVEGLSGGGIGPIRAAAALHDVTALKAVEEMRADFVANVSHELRSPLSSLSGFIETLQTTAKDDGQARKKFLGIMEGEAGRMARLIDDLLSLSQIESNEHVRPTNRVDMVRLIGGVADALVPTAKKRGITVDVEVPSHLPDVIGDEDQLVEVFQNLMENAVKYGAEGSPVTVGFEAIARMPGLGRAGVRISVVNRGEGIASQHLPRLTERFYRIDKGRSRAMGGTGLGLAIVKHIVSRHRGRLEITSEHGGATCFSVTLPAADGK